MARTLQPANRTTKGMADVNTISVVEINWEGWDWRSAPNEISRQQLGARLVNVAPDSPMWFSSAWEGRSGVLRRDLTHS